MPLYEATADLGLDENYFTEIRDVFSRHFEGSVGDSSVAPTVAVAVKVRFVDCLLVRLSP